MFKKRNGFLLVAKHDHLPNLLLKEYPKIDVYELELADFIAFCRENFTRLLNRQIKLHSETRVWLMYQGPNFNLRKGKIKPARKSKIWCPTENLTGFDIAIEDRVLFIKSRGANRIQIQKEFNDNKQIHKDWIISEIWIGEIKSKVFSRREYCQYKKIKSETQLWLDDPKMNNIWRWNRVFEFYKIKVINKDIKMIDLYNQKDCKTFVLKVLEVVCYLKSREVSLRDYRNTIEVLL